MRTHGKNEKLREAKILPVEEEWLEDVMTTAELFMQEGEETSWSASLVRAARRVAAEQKTMPGPLLAALEGRKRKRERKEDDNQEEEG